MHAPPVQDILVEGTRIAALGPDLGARAGVGATVIDATGRMAIPGFVNAHYHSHDVLAKGLFEGQPLELWSLHSAPMGANRSREEVRLRTLLGALECLRSGITTVQDMINLVPLREDYVDTVLDAYAEAGIRVVCSLAVRDVPQVDTVPRLRERLPSDIQAVVGDRAADGRVQLDFIARQFERRPATSRLHWAISPSAPQRCTPELLKGVADLSSRLGLPVYTHVYESKWQALHARLTCGDFDGSYIAYLENAGLLNDRLTIVHGVWLTPEEIDRLAAGGAAVALNTVSNLKTQSGIAPIVTLRRAGVRLAMGCDNCSCSDVQNIFQAMKLFCLFSAVGDPTPGDEPAAEAVRVATEGGARTAGLGDRIGALRPGMKADLALIDLADPAFVPFNSAARQLVYSETGRGIETVIVDGRIVMRDRRIATIDEASLHREVAAAMPAFRRDYDAVAAGIRHALEPMRSAHADALAQDIGLDRFIRRER